MVVCLRQVLVLFSLLLNFINSPLGNEKQKQLPFSNSEIQSNSRVMAPYEQDSLITKYLKVSVLVFKGARSNILIRLTKLKHKKEQGRNQSSILIQSNILDG